MNLQDKMQFVDIPLPPANARISNGFTRWGNNNRYWLTQKDDAAFFGDYSTGESHQWFADDGKELSATELAKRKEKLAELRKVQEAEQLRIHETVATKAKQQWDALQYVGNSQYLERKQVNDFGLRFGESFIAVPLYDVNGKLWSLQSINNDGTKRFSFGGRKRGCFHTTGMLKDASTVYVAEGYATAASIHKATEKPVIVAFDAGNLEPVIEVIKAKYPDVEITIAADNDVYGERNTGREKAEEAARKYGCKVVLPVFKDKSTKPTDFNDLHCLEGLETVKAQLLAGCSEAKPTETKAKQISPINAILKNAESISRLTCDLNPVTLHALLNMEIPQRGMLLYPIIPTQGLTMLYAARGIGKTYVSLSIALCVATGSTILGSKWKAEKPHKVLFVDGEMPAIVLQERLALLVCSNDRELPDPEHLKIITPDMQEFGIADLATAEGQIAIEQHLYGVELLILDNLSSLCRSGKENEAESWLPIQEWLLKLRRRGISVLLVHHAGKAGNQRGTSKREDLLDTVITLKRPSDYETTQGARFEVHYEKARGFYGDVATPFEAHLQNDDDGKQFWAVKDLEDRLLERIIELKKEGLTQRTIAIDVGCSASTVNRLLKKAGTYD